MKPYAPLLCALSLGILLSGCSTPPPADTKSPIQSPAVATPTSSPTAPSPAVSAEPYTEEAARKVFEENNRKNGTEDRTVTACVLVDDGFDDMTAVLLYTNERQNNSCELGFVYEDEVYFPVVIVANEHPEKRDFESEPDTLTYTGNGTATVVMRELATGTRYRYTITCERSETATNFVVDTDILEQINIS